MSSKTRTIYQNLIDDNDHRAITLQEDILESKLTKELFDNFYDGVPTPRYVGLAPIYSQRQALCRLVIAVKTKVLIVQFHAKDKGANAYKGRGVLSSEVLCNPDVTLLAFNFNKLAVALHTDQGLRVLNGVDVQSSCGSDRSPLSAIKYATAGIAVVMEENTKRTFETETLDPKRTTASALQAWVAQCLHSYPMMENNFQAANKIDTVNMTETRLRTITQIERGEHRLSASSRTATSHEYSAAGTRRDSAFVTADRFATRFMQDTAQKVTVRDHMTGIDIVVDAQVSKINGRQTALKANINLEGRAITSITTQGRDAPTRAEQQREITMLRALQGKEELSDSPFLKYIFEQSDQFTWPETFPVSDTIPPIVSTRPLNGSQEKAVEAMLSNDNNQRLLIIQGPPGSGKTSVIAAFVTSAITAGASGIWLVAQSNIAVKNIAEKLVDVGFDNWRLLVSQGFHFGWHDHIYSKVNKNLIISKDFKRAHRQIQGVKVFLCTLSMLSNPTLHIFTSVNPIKTLVVDEASQITLGSYVVPLTSFPTISKMCMIGDDKQLPPYGSEDSEENMKSIFEVEHLRPSVQFLDIQYRMPPLIGDVVSEVVYDGQLRSNPEHPIPYDTPSCWFVHVQESEERRFDTSWHNPAERATVLKIAEMLQAEDKEYCFISPYDAQRNLMEKDMTNAGLDWKDKCFNVDSFQGNEKDYIIISLRGMYIVTSWNFVQTRAHNTLVGRMAAKFGDEVWINPEHLQVEEEEEA
ncbi:P-loop containing nucleoside triphosphate hydrolase protein [Lenzites betulinus]|nr:P-loop containing nucleoside triphosphate hydrolase protein [Lenzites betulinus]